MPSVASRAFARLVIGVWSWLSAVMAEAVDYSREIQPLLQQRCYSCHSRIKQEGGLRLDAGVLVHRGGKSGPVLTHSANDPGELIRRITSTDPDERMPAEGRPLTEAEVALLREWVDQGARFPSDETIPVAPEQHWAFQPLRRPPIPEVKDASWPRNPVDSFVLAKLESRGWTPSPSAVPTALLRRVYLDLAGLPPSLAEQEAFGANTSPNRLDHVVDELLARPTYGERWARHWLDVVRYADSNGYERDAEKPSVWRYRDYVISALNADLPFDRFIIEQLAGDELPAVNRETLVATTFTRLGHWDDEPADPETDRFDQLDDIVSTTGQAFLGLTIGCARCHDHKFEPLTTKDYYQLVSVFAPLKRPQKGRTELTIPAGTPEEVALQMKRDRVIADWLRRTNELPKAEIEAHVSRLRAETPDLPEGYLMRDAGPSVPPTHVLIRGSATRPGAEVSPNIPAVLSRNPFPPVESQGPTSGRRLALARWMACADNPLTARVIVNRIWQQHFGAGLVRTPNDFGTMGEPPTHPELLDWLADRFMHEGRWSLKWLHRLILNSNAWRMSRAMRTDYAEQDPENRWLWHQSYRRLEVEALRDSILAVSGELNRERFGRAVFLPIPAAAMEANTDRDSVWRVSDAADISRRTIYAFVKRGLVVPMLEVLDLCDTVSSSPRRQVTTVPTQALTLFNGDLVNTQAARLAKRLDREAGADVNRKLDLAYQLTLVRPPSATERQAFLEFLGRESIESADDQAKWVQLCRVLFNLNEFAYPE